MKQKLMLLFAGALAVFAFGALPAVAAAEPAPTIDPETGTFPLTFSGTTGAASLTTSLSTVTASSVDVHGEFETASTGWVIFTFTDVTSGGKTCTGTSPPAPEGTVVTTTLPFHLIMIDSTAQKEGGTPGILITPGTGAHFASFTCPNTGGIVVGGNGIIGDISSPKCGEGFKNSTTISFASSSTGVQKFQQIETAGTKFSLNAKTIIGTIPASEDAEGTVGFGARNAKLTCP